MPIECSTNEHDPKEVLESYLNSCDPISKYFLDHDIPSFVSNDCDMELQEPSVTFNKDEFAEVQSDSNQNTTRTQLAAGNMFFKIN